jgi:hypothetical protein
MSDRVFDNYMVPGLEILLDFTYLVRSKTFLNINYL